MMETPVEGGEPIIDDEEGLLALVNTFCIYSPAVKHHCQMGEHPLVFVKRLDEVIVLHVRSFRVMFYSFAFFLH